MSSKTNMKHSSSTASTSTSTKKRTNNSDPKHAANTTTASSSATSAAKKKPKPEKRLKRFRSKPSIAISTRIDRAASQKMFLVHTSDVTTCPSFGGPSVTFAVLGSTGNVYNVVLCKIPSCTCPDHARGNLCKHVLFVMLKVVGLDASSSSLVFQAALLEEELDEIVELLATRQSKLGRSVVANKAVREEYAKLSGGGVGEEGKNASDYTVQRKSTDENDCLICYDSLGANMSALTYCQGTCGTNFHAECMTMWTSKCKDEPTCPACRNTWLDVKTGGCGACGGSSSSSKDGNSEGYTNLGTLQGQRKTRDTSTYRDYPEWYEYSRYNKRRRW